MYRVVTVSHSKSYDVFCIYPVQNLSKIHMCSASLFNIRFSHFDRIRCAVALVARFSCVFKHTELTVVPIAPLD